MRQTGFLNRNTVVIGTKDYVETRSVSIHSNFVPTLIHSLRFKPQVITTGIPTLTNGKKGKPSTRHTAPTPFQARFSELSLLRDIIRAAQSFQMLRVGLRHIPSSSIVHWFEHYGIVHAALRVTHPQAKNCITLFSYLRRYPTYDSLLRLNLQGFDRIVTTTSQFRRILVNLGISARKTVVIPLGVDLRYFQSRRDETVKRKLGLRERDRLVTWFGNITPSTEDDLRLVLDIAQKAHSEDANLNFLLCFKNVPPNARQLMATGVKILGRVDIRSVMWASDMVILPFTQHLPFAVQPLTMVEALACGVPVGILCHPDLQEVVSHRVNGIAVSRPELLLKDLLDTLSHDDVLAVMKTNARRTAVERHDIDKVAQAYIDLWRGTSIEN